MWFGNKQTVLTVAQWVLDCAGNCPHCIPQSWSLYANWL